MRKPCFGLGKGDNFFPLQTLAQVDSAERMTLIPGKTFLHTNRALDHGSSGKLLTGEYSISIDFDFSSQFCWN